MFRKVDCLRLHVADLPSALQFYRDKLGLTLVWRRGGEEAGLLMTASETELVLVSGSHELPETDIMVESADSAALEFERLGGRVVVAPFDINIGRCAVVADPWDNLLVLLDSSKGKLRVDSEGNVV